MKSELEWTHGGDLAVKAELDAQIDQYMTNFAGSARLKSKKSIRVERKVLRKGPQDP